MQVPMQVPMQVLGMRDRSVLTSCTVRRSGGGGRIGGFWRIGDFLFSFWELENHVIAIPVV